MTWGPWIEHDGRGCPCVGAFVESITACGEREEHIAGGPCRDLGRDPNGKGSAWVWPGLPEFDNIIRYRIRKPRGMEILEQALKVEEPA